MKTLLCLAALLLPTVCLAQCPLCGGYSTRTTTVRTYRYRAPRVVMAAPVEVPANVRSFKSKTKTHRDGRTETKTTIRN